MLASRPPCVAPVAVIGIGCFYPGARGPRQLWENVLARRREFRRIPPQRLSADYYDPDPAAPDRTYARRGAFLDGFSFDWAALRIPQATFESTDLVHWLALHVALQAVEDAGYGRGSVPRERTGVVVGNTLTGEYTRSLSMRPRWPFVRRALLAAARERGLSATATEELARTMEDHFKSVFPAITDDTLAGGLSNTIAGRICNVLDLHGGGYTVDAACASSVLSVITAADHLASRNMDLVIAGGVDVSLDTFELVGFAKVGALTRDDMNVYDRRAAGFLPGEGCGFVVLKRLEDALADGDSVYAVLRGWGLSSDGKGGLTTPTRDGQATALLRAYEKAGYAASDLDFVEGHGTGTSVGDRVELEGIAAAVESSGPAPARRCGVTSLKSIVGHTKAAAGIGAVIKAVIALNRRVVPPTAGCETPSEVFDGAARCLYPVLLGEIAAPSARLRAGVSGMGFGGINTHLTLESADPPSPRLAPAVEERALLVSHQEAEVFVLAAGSAAELATRLGELAEVVEQASLSDLPDLAAQLSRELTPGGRVRAAVVAGHPERAAERLRELERRLREGPPAVGGVWASPDQALWVGHAAARTRLGFLFPGQGSQQLLMARTLVERYAWARAAVAKAEEAIRDTGGRAVSEFIWRAADRALDVVEAEGWARALAETDVAQPAICLASVLHARHLRRLGLRPACVGGHSLGELTAFHVAGAFDEAALFRLAAARGQAMAQPDRQRGAMVSLACSAEGAQALVRQVTGYAAVANRNAPAQVVVSGEEPAVLQVMERATREGIVARRLPVSNAFHSRLVAGAAAALRARAELPDEVGPLACRLFSSVSGAEVASGTALREHFAAQVLAPVDFVAMVQRMAGECDLLLEVGPGRVLSGLVSEITEGRTRCLPVASQPHLARDLDTALAAFFVHGGEVNWAALYEGRLVRPFVPARQRLFIENPCERPFAPVAAVPAARVDVVRDAGATSGAVSSGAAPTAAPPRASGVAEALLELAAARTGFPRETLDLGMKLLDDLNLDSIKAGALVAAAAKQHDVAGKLDPSKFAKATLADVAAALGAALGPGPAAPPAPAARPADSTPAPEWVRNFGVTAVRAPRRAVDEAAAGEDDWRAACVMVVADASTEELASALEKRLRAAGAACRRATFHEAEQAAGGWAGGTSCLLTLLPRLASADEPSSVREALWRLGRVAGPVHHGGTTRRPTLTYVQSGDGRFGVEPATAETSLFPATSFARSLHLERPDLRVRVVELSPAIGAPAASALIMDESGGPEAFRAAGYDAALTRWTTALRLQQPSRYPARALAWGAEDVILVTGGAKGITAECALGLARQSGARFALVGSSAASPQGEVSRTLERFRREDVTARYYACDLTDRAAVERMVASVRSELGAITGVVHGAGLNRPRLVAESDLEEAVAEVGPKLLGALHLCHALDREPPRLFVALSSVIGVTGMPGNAWYAFANEALDLVLGRFGAAHPQTAVTAIAYSVWSQVGMGARLGAVEALERMRIGAIPPAEGVERFVRLFACDPGARQVVVTARLGGLDTWPAAEAPVPERLRFIERVVDHLPEVHLAARTRLTLDRDVYVRDHVYHGSPLFPTVFGLEAMAQAAARLLADATPAITRIEDVRLERPIVVDPAHGVEVEIAATRLEDAADGERRIRACIRADSTGFQVEHFAATFVLGEPAEPAFAPPAAPLARLDLDPRRDLYGRLLWQGPLFQRMDEVLALDGERVVFRASADPAAAEKGAFAEGRLVLGDPFFRDVLLQSIQLVVPRHDSLPLRIERIDLATPGHDAGDRLVTTVLVSPGAEEDVAEVTAVGPDGRVVERLTGYRLRVLREAPERPTAEDLAAPGAWDERTLARRVEDALGALGVTAPRLALDHAPSLPRLATDERRRRERPLIARAAGATNPGDLRVEWLSSGKPCLPGAAIGISLSHDDAYCLCVAGRGPQGCDLTPVEHREHDEWIALLGPAGSASFESLAASGDEEDRAGSRVWAAVEAARKATGAEDVSLSVGERRDDVVVLQAAHRGGQCTVVTLPVLLTRGPERIVALVAAEAGDGALARAAIPAGACRVNLALDGPQGQPVQEVRLIVPFQDCTGPSRRVPFSRLAAWMGKLRELALTSRRAAMVRDLSTGQFGMVTNSAEVEVLGEARALDLVDMRIWTENIEGPTVDLGFEFLKLDGEPAAPVERIARARQRFTWVRIVGHGHVEPAPFPAYLADYLESVRPAGGRASRPRALAEPLAALVPGAALGPRPARPAMLASDSFFTTWEDANAVGNVYYAQYFAWQARSLETFLHTAAPGALGDAGRGELVCGKSRVDFLREAMPFDRLQVTMAVDRLHERGGVLLFEYFRVAPDGGRSKLSVGHLDVCWARRGTDGRLQAAAWPHDVREVLEGRATGTAASAAATSRTRPDSSPRRRYQ